MMKLSLWVRAVQIYKKSKQEVFSHVRVSSWPRISERKSTGCLWSDGKSEHMTGHLTYPRSETERERWGRWERRRWHSSLRLIFFPSGQASLLRCWERWGGKRGHGEVGSVPPNVIYNWAVLKPNTFLCFDSFSSFQFVLLIILFLSFHNLSPHILNFSSLPFPN